MDYLYENLGPDRFQQFCQALLLNSFPKLQCLPVRQPDGGRDALTFYDESGNDGFIVFQVKFVERPLANKDTHKWLLNVLEEEAPKVAKLIPEGATEYYLLTNVPGTAHLDVGSIDKGSEILNSAIDIPATCWWRDDLNRRLENARDLRWSYPELYSGADMLASLVQSKPHEDKMVAIKAYLTSQYEMDEKVRFRQVDLENLLLDLFIDVPMTLRTSAEGKLKHSYYSVVRRFAEAQRSKLGGQEGEVDTEWDDLTYHLVYEPDLRLGAASLLLDSTFQSRFSQVVIEGAPGQGKSTIVQYLCQVHRMRILDKSEALDLVPETHKLAGIRIPFKVDLRDYAAWLNKQNPFSSEEDNQVPENWKESLETFLAAQVEHFSGGLGFSADDLQSVAGVSALLIVLDGLDEVADIKVRQKVVKQVTTSVKRLRQNAATIQVIVTSRPAAFANSPGFIGRDFPYFELQSIDKELITVYSEKWLRAKNLHGRPEGAEVRKILKSKLDQPHLRDLARNLMQLAILLNLIHTRGSSLPDKRTALYDNYMDSFFNREAEKSHTVREYRYLLIDIHRYLAWVLHSEAEGHGTGSIGADSLRSLLEQYLAEEEYDASIVEELFPAMVERVVALVSRVQGTYEFEVQPLREYFAAKFLYETAPYSPPGAEAQGTKPDRFDAIARNSYWLNVTRFYGGCYSKGELPSLADSLAELCQEDGYRYINHPRILAATLLSDWVFAQHPRSMKKVVSLLLDGLGLRYATTPRTAVGRPSTDTLTLPNDGGGEELIEKCFEVLSTFPARDYALELAELVRENSTFDQRLSAWRLALSSAQSEALTRWIEYGLYLGLLSSLPNGDLESLVSDDPYNRERLNAISKANRNDFFELSEERANVAVDAILDREIDFQGRLHRPTVLTLFARYIDPVQHEILLLQSPRRMTVSAALARFDYPIRHDSIVDPHAAYEVLANCSKVVDTARTQMELSVSDWLSTLKPWDTIVEEARAMFGDRWALFHLANTASGIRSRQETYQEYSELLDHSRPLCRRARYARLRAGNPSWWSKQLGVAQTPQEQAFVLLLLLTWGSTKTLTSLVPLVDDVLSKLPMQDWLRLSRSMRLPLRHSESYESRPAIALNVSRLPGNLEDRTVCVLQTRATQSTWQALLKKYLSDYRGTEPTTLALLQSTAVEHLFDSAPQARRKWLEVVQRSYEKGAISRQYATYYLLRDREAASLALDTAQQIAGEPNKYPRFLVGFAEERCKLDVSSKVTPVIDVAQRQRWLALPD